FLLFFSHHPPPTELSPLSLHDALPISSERDRQAMINLHRKHTGDLHSSNDALDLDVSVLPNGVDLDYFHPMPQDRRRFNIVFSRSEEHTSELQSRFDLVCRLLLEKKKK